MGTRPSVAITTAALVHGSMLVSAAAAMHHLAFTAHSARHEEPAAQLQNPPELSRHYASPNHIYLPIQATEKSHKKTSQILLILSSSNSLL